MTHKECTHDMEKKGRIYLALDDEGNIKRRTYIKGEGHRPLGMWANELEEFTDYPNIGKIANAPELYYKEEEEFKRKVKTKVTNKLGGKLVTIGNMAEIEFKDIPEDIEEFKVKVGDREVMVKNGETIQVTSSNPGRISVRVMDKRVYQNVDYVAVFVPKVEEEMPSRDKPEGVGNDGKGTLR